MLPPTTLYKYNTLDNFAKASYKGDSDALKNSEIGMVYSCETFMSQNAPENASVTPGTATAYKVLEQRCLRIHSISGTATTGTILVGDKFIVGGYIYTVTEDLTLVSGAGTLKVDQKIPATITATSVKIINKAHALGFHRNGLALVTRQLALPMGASRASIASANGLAVRVVMDYDSATKTP